MGKNGRTKLRQADIKKVDLVDDPANPGGWIALAKRNKEEPMEQESVFKRVMAAIAGVFGKSDEDVEKGLMAEIEQKNGPKAQTFDTKLNENRKRRVLSEIWDYTYAIQNSIESILMDESLTTEQKQELALGSVDQFGETITAAIPTWLSGEPVIKGLDEEEIEKAGRSISSATRARLEEAVSTIKALYEEEVDPDEDDPEEEGESDDGDDMGDGPENEEQEVGKMIDKTKLDPEVRVYVEDLEKRAAGLSEDNGDIFKGLTPGARAVVEDLQKRAEAAERSEAIAKAKDYEVLGGKADEIGPALMQIRKSNPEQAEKIEEVLKAATARVSAGDLFKEQGTGTPSGAGSAAGQLESRAKEIMKAKGISFAKAYVEAGEELPEALKKSREEA